MKKKWLSLLGAGLLVSACAQMPETNSGQDVTDSDDLINCPNISIPTRVVAIRPDGMYDIYLSPQHICVARTRTITFQLAQNPEEGTVRTEGKDEASSWLDGTNSPDRRRITIQVPADVALETFKYNVYWEGKNSLDPRVSVRTEDRN